MKWLTRLLPGHTRDAELDEELRSHIAMDVAARVARGERRDEAERAARREFGNALSVAEMTREMWGGASLERFIQDVKHGLRSLRRHPGFVAVALGSLALGIGANTAAFSLADAALFRPLAIRDAGRVVVVGARTPRLAIGNLSLPELRDLREATRSFSGIVAARSARVAVARRGDPVPQMRFALAVTDGFFDVLGVPAAIGRTFVATETATRGREPVAMLSYDYWQTQFGADPAIVGATIRVNTQPFTIVGVLPASFTGLSQFLRPAIFVPMTALERPGEPSLFDQRAQFPLMVRGRLAEGATLSDAQAELEVVTRALGTQYPEDYRERTIAAMTEVRARMAEAPPLLPIAGLLMLLAVLVLVIACANVASLQLARARARSREIAVRLAIGAGRLRLTRQLVTESLLVAAAGGAVGVGAALVAIRLLASLQLPTDTPLGLAVQLDVRVLAAAAAAAVAATCIFGLVPAWKTSAVSLTAALKSDDLAPRAGKLWGRHALVGAQIAFCSVLLVVSGALLEAFARMSAADPGIRAGQVMMFEFDPGLAGRGPTEASGFYRQLLDRVRVMPGVTSAALASAIPFRPNFSEESIVPEGHAFRGTENHVRVPVNVVDPGYFTTMGAAISRGRAFGVSDTANSPAVAIVNEELAARYWSGDAIGKRLFLLPGREPFEVIGVARTARYTSLVETPQPHLFLAYAQRPRVRMLLLAAADGEPLALTAPILDAVRSIEADQPVFNVRDFRTYYEQGALAMPRVLTQMAGAAGATGLGLALVGIYGLVSYSVSRRTREFGVRMAIGASRGAVLRLVLRQGLVLALSGALVGILLAIPVFLAISAGMAGIGPLSPWTLVAVPSGLILVALAACLGPARRATAINPTVALRTD